MEQRRAGSEHKAQDPGEGEQVQAGRAAPCGTPHYRFISAGKDLLKWSSARYRFFYFIFLSTQRSLVSQCVQHRFSIDFLLMNFEFLLRLMTQLFFCSFQTNPLLLKMWNTSLPPEGFSQERPTGHLLFRTASVKAFKNRLWDEALLCYTRQKQGLSEQITVVDYALTQLGNDL